MDACTRITNISRRHFVGGIVGTAAAALLAACGGGGSSGGASDTGQITVRAGWVKVLQWTHWADTPKYIGDKNVKIELTEFKTSNEVLVALTAGSLDMGAIGYNHLAGALARGDTPLTFIAGLSSGSSRFVASKNSGIQSWDDLKGKRVAGARGSTQYFQFATALKKHSLDVDKDLKFTNVSGAPDMVVALQNGNVDAIMCWEPNASQAIVSAFGVDVPAVRDTLYTDSFKVTSGVVARDSFLKDHPKTTQTVVNAYYKSWQKITTDRQYWLDTFRGLTEADPKVLEAAAPNCILDFAMNQKDIEAMMRVLVQQGVLDKDVTADEIKRLNYSYIAKASGKSAAELGQS